MKRFQLNPFQHSFAPHIETSHLICIPNQMIRKSNDWFLYEIQHWTIWKILMFIFLILKDLVFFNAANSQLFFSWKKSNFGIILIIFTILGKKIRSTRHLPHLSKIINLFLKYMSKIRANNHFTLRFKKMISDTFAMKTIDFLNLKIRK